MEFNFQSKIWPHVLSSGQVVEVKNSHKNGYLVFGYYKPGLLAKNSEPIVLLA